LRVKIGYVLSGSIARYHFGTSTSFNRGKGETRFVRRRRVRSAFSDVAAPARERVEQPTREPPKLRY